MRLKYFLYTRSSRRNSELNWTALSSRAGSGMPYNTSRIMLGQCTMRALSVARRARLPPTIMLGGLCCREISAPANLSTKQQMKGFTIKDQRPPRPRVAKEKRKQYLAQRKASFEVEQERATSLGLDWGIRSAL